jgi:hypothetical protein
MRIVLEKGKQRELIELAKIDLTWGKLAKEINCNPSYLMNELRYAKRLLSGIRYKKLCELAKVNFDKFILDKKEDYWGRSKGGQNSRGNTKNFIEPQETKELAELFGIILGDGHIEKTMNGNKIRVYSVDIAGDSRDDKIYLENCVSNLFSKLFNEKGKIRFSKNSNGMHITVYGKKIVEFVNKKGIMPGNKKNNEQKIPDWILNNKEYLKSCLRGLIDADGCIYYISKKTNRNLRISFTSYIPKLMGDVRNSFMSLGFHPSKILREKEIYLSSKDDVNKFLKEIGFSNNKHLKRLQRLKKDK